MRKTAIAASIALIATGSAFADCGTYEQQLAHNHVKDVAKRHLVAPKTANFPFQPTRKVLEPRGSACVVTLESWVDSKNAYGVKVRKYYVAEVEIDGKAVTINTFGFTS